MRSESQTAVQALLKERKEKEELLSTLEVRPVAGRVLMVLW